MEWKACLIDYDNKTQIANWLIQTEDKRLFSTTTNGNGISKDQLITKIAKIAKTYPNRITYMGEKRRRDRLVVYDFMVMHDNPTYTHNPPF